MSMDLVLQKLRYAVKKLVAQLLMLLRCRRYGPIPKGLLLFHPETLPHDTKVNDFVPLTVTLMLKIAFSDFVAAVGICVLTNTSRYLRNSKQDDSWLKSSIELAVLWPNILGNEIMLLWTTAQYIGFVMSVITTLCTPYAYFTDSKNIYT